MPRRDNDIILHRTLASDRVHALRVPAAYTFAAFGIEFPPFRS